MLDGLDDEQLLAELREAARERQAVPRAFVTAAKDAFAWRDIDAELAQLTYDSSRESDLIPSTRSETASIRALTFTSAHLSIELEVTADCLLGQIIPPQSGTIETQTRAGGTGLTLADEVGLFCVDPLPADTFRLRCQTANGLDVVTGWVTL
jgi:hypothetical protein